MSIYIRRQSKSSGVNTQNRFLDGTLHMKIVITLLLIIKSLKNYRKYIETNNIIVRSINGRRAFIWI